MQRYRTGKTLVARFLAAVYGVSDTMFHRWRAIRSTGEIESAIEITLGDQRADRSTPLPAIPPHEIVIP
jgi:hypothetical protein